MADKKIVNLDALVSASSTDLYETSLNGAGSRKETRSQMLTYMNSNVQLPSTAKVTGLDTALSDKASLANSNVFAGTKQTINQLVIKGKQSNILAVGTPVLPGTISAAILTGGIVAMNPGSDLTMTFDTATNILAALPAGLTDNSTFYTRLINTSTTYKITLVPGADTLFNGMPSAIISPGQTFDLVGIFTSVSLPVLIFYGGTDLSTFAKLAANNIFTGSNTFSPIYIKGQQANILSISTPAIPGLISATQLIGGIIYFNGISGIMTLDSATNIRDALNTSLGVTIADNTAFRLTIMNGSGTETITLAPGDDTTYYGQNVIATSQNFDLIGIFTSVSTPSLSFYGATDLARYAAKLKDNLFFGINTFTQSTYIKEIIGPPVFRNAITSALTGSGTLTNLQVISQSILFDPALDATWIFPLGADIDSLLGTLSIDEGFPLTLINQSSTKTVSFSDNTGISFAGLSEPGTLLLSPMGVAQVILTKTDASTYTLVGSSHGVFNVIPGDFHATGTVSGDGISGNIGDFNFPRFNEVAQSTCIQKNYNSTSTITAADFIRKTITSNSVANINLTLPTGSDLQGTYSFWATDDFAIEDIYFINLSATGTVTLVANTGFTIAGVPVPIIPVLGTKIVKARKVSANSYVLYG